MLLCVTQNCSTEAQRSLTSDGILPVCSLLKIIDAGPRLSFLFQRQKKYTALIMAQITPIICNTPAHRCQTRGPVAGSGPPNYLIWPTKANKVCLLCFLIIGFVLFILASAQLQNLLKMFFPSIFSAHPIVVCCTSLFGCLI